MNSNTGSPLPKIAAYRKAGAATFLCGQVASRADGGPIDTFADEVRIVFEKVQATLAAAGGTLEDVVSVRAYLTDFENFAEFNRAWSENFPLNPPARTTVQAGLLKPFRVELEVVADIRDVEGEDRLP